MDFIQPYIWVGSILFARIGTILMLAPGWGESVIPVRFRLVIALFVVSVLVPTQQASLPAQPSSLVAMASIILSEIVIGLVLGGAVRIFMSALSIAGQIAGLQTGLGFAQQLNPIMDSQGAVLSAFLAMMGIVLVFVFGLHHIMLRGAAQSYGLFPPGQIPNPSDIAMYGYIAMADAFRIGFQIAGPTIVLGLVFNISLGLVARLIPQIQIFFIALPSSIMLGLIVMAIGFGAGLMVWLDRLADFARLNS